MNDRLTKIITRKARRQFKDQTGILDKLSKQERLADNEFWKVYKIIWKEGPDFVYRNPDKWVSHSD